MNKPTDKSYHETIAALEQQGIARAYIVGWAAGFLGNPKLEEQRITAPYEAGYEDGANGATENAVNWKAGNAP